jgi:hypothetical protein
MKGCMFSALRRCRDAIARSGASLGVLLALTLPFHASAQCTTENLARTGVASATSTFSGYSPARTNDGDRNTGLGGAYSWSNARETATTPALPASLDIALPAAATVDRIILHTTAGWQIQDYDLQSFNGSQWTTLQAVRGNTATTRTHQFSPVSMSRVRVVGLRGPASQTIHVRINELEICRAAATLTSVRGNVTQFGTGLPLRNVRVDLGGSLIAFTDANGAYRIDNVPAGTYTLRPSRLGWTFGSPRFQTDTMTFQAAGGTIVRGIVGYDRNPIVYATGWTDNVLRFDPARGALTGAGYLPVEAPIQTSLSYTPPFRTNALNVRTAIDDALYRSGQPQVILFGHSMGGIVARTYVESDLYRGDVSQLYTFGSPHRGVPNLVALACVANQPAVCQMSKPGMLLFNVTHGQRAWVNYHAIGGDAPLIRTHRICFRIFGRRICIASIPLPDFRFRNFGGWVAGLAIPGGDDALVQTYSSTGMPGRLDRFRTEEVHIATQLGRRDYYQWDGGNNLSQQAYGQCVAPLLIARSRSNCGSVSGQSVLVPFLSLKTNASAMTTRAAIEGFEQQGRAVQQAAGANQRIEREVLVDGSPMILSVKLSSGTAAVSAIDPSGQVFDRAFAAGILDGEPLPGEVISDELHPDMFTFETEGGATTLQFLAPRPGRWRLIVDTQSTVVAGSRLETLVAFSGPLGMHLSNDFPFLLAGDRAPIKVVPSTPVFSGSGEATILRKDGTSDRVSLLRQADGSFVGEYPVPNASGTASLSWFVTGTTVSGAPYERAGSDAVQIGRRSLTVQAVGSEVPEPRPGAAGYYTALVVPVDVASEFAGDALVSADLVDAAGNVVANAARQQAMAIGTNRIALRFDGADLHASRANGPYRLTNLVTVDQRSESLMSDWLLDRMSTRAYDHRVFGPVAPKACGSQNLLAGASAQATSTFSGYSPARVVDGDRNTGLGGAYSWSNARETATTPALPATLTLAMGSARTVEQILVYSTQDWEIRDYDIEYFDGARWDAIERVRGNTQVVREHRFPATAISALRIVGLSGPDHQTIHVRVNEVEAFACTPTLLSRPVSAPQGAFIDMAHLRNGIDAPARNWIVR